MPTWHIPSAIFKIYRIFGHISFGIWVSFPNMGILAVPCRLKKKLCWTAVAKPDLLGHFFQLFCGKHDLLITLPQPQPPTNAPKCTAMHSNFTKCTELCCFKKTLLDCCGPIWFARPLFSTVLRKAWLSNYTTSASTPHQCTKMHCNAFKFRKMHWIVSLF